MTRFSRRELALRAMNASLDVRADSGYDLATPICVYDLCERRGVTVRFVDINMEGVYEHLPRPRIYVSALRPLGRRAFNCAHEFGHHVFGHGFTVDELREEFKGPPAVEVHEFLADAFAGFLLMPTLGLRSAFASRGLTPGGATPLQLLCIACSFGVSYSALVAHLAFGIRELSESRARSLLRLTPQKVVASVVGELLGHGVCVIDATWSGPTVDLETGMYILAPFAFSSPCRLLVKVRTGNNGVLYRAERPGIEPIAAAELSRRLFVRVMPHQYVGLARYRHLADDSSE